MNARTKTGLEILQIAAVIGVAGDVLLRATPWGLNVTLFNIIFAAGMITLLWRNAPQFLTRQTIALFGALVFFASMFSWRDAIELRIADTIAIIATLSIIFIPRMKIATQLAGVFQYGVAFLWSAANAFLSPFILIGVDIKWTQIPRTGATRHIVSVLRGIAIVTPLLLIFGGLFVAADAVYAGWVQRVFNIKPEIIVTHVILTSLFAYLSAGYLRGVLMQDALLGVPTSEAPVSIIEPEVQAADSSKDSSPHLPNNLTVLEHINLSDPPNQPPPPQAEAPPKAEPSKWDWAKFDNTVLPGGLTLGSVEIAVVLGLMNLLFLSFVIVQVPYLFGGMELVQNTPDFKLATYARRGFGELVTVAGLVLPILLASHWLIRKESRIATNIFRVLAGIQIALLFVIMASAVQRLVLLTGELGYGMTTIRLYPLIFMSWLAIVFVWFAATVLRGARNHFAWGALWSAFLILGATHVLNPDAFIARTNVALMQQGREFDATYNSQLSDDAMPILMSAFDNLDPNSQGIVVRRFAERYQESKCEGDLRSWNISRSQTQKMLTSSPDLVKEMEAINALRSHRYNRMGETVGPDCGDRSDRESD
ncbi:MAG: DUF4173 domain-containing protein [Pyrinomonadaceae bacterium]